MAHGVPDHAAATAKAIVAIAAAVRRQALIMASATPSFIGVLLAIAAVSMLLARKSQAHGGRRRSRSGANDGFDQCGRVFRADPVLAGAWKSSSMYRFRCSRLSAAAAALPFALARI